MGKKNKKGGQDDDDVEAALRSLKLDDDARFADGDGQATPAPESAMSASLATRLPKRIASLLMGDSRKLEAVPMQRSQALTFSYSRDLLPEFSMYNGSCHVPNNRDAKGDRDDRSNVHRSLTLAPTDS